MSAGWVSLDLDQVDLPGKAFEFLEFIANSRRGSRTKTELRRHRGANKKYWSSRTIKKQTRRLVDQGIIAERKHEVEVTDHGLWILVDWLKSRSRSVKKMVKLAAEKYPNGVTLATYGYLLTLKPWTKMQRINFARSILMQVNDALIEGKFPPNYCFKLTITSNSKGEVSTRVQTPLPLQGAKDLS
jgi:hypothetical protein